MKKILVLALACASLFFSPSANAAYPEKTITMIVPFAAGGNSDMVARALLIPLQEELGQKIIVKNVGGAGGTLGTAELSAAKADGYTIGYLPTGPVVLQPAIRKLPYDAQSLTPVACVSDTPYVFMVKSDSAMNNLGDAKKELLANSGKMAFGSSGPGTLPHLTSAATVMALGGDAKHIPDRSSAEGMKSLAGNVIQFFADGTSFLPAYDVKALAIFSPERSLAYPDIPTAKEQGYDLNFSIWGGIFVPKGVSPEVIARLEAAVEKSIASEQFQDIAKKNSIIPSYMNSKDFSTFVLSEAEGKKQIISDLGLKK